MRSHLLSLLLFGLLGMSCTTRTDEILSGFERYPLSDGWSILLPPNGHYFEQFDSIHHRKEQGYRFHGDSLVVTFGGAAVQFVDSTESFVQLVNRTRTEQFGFCVGGSPAPDINAYPFVLINNRMVGVRLREEFQGSRSTALFVDQYDSRKNMSVGFTNLSKRDVVVMEAAMHSIRHQQP